MESSGGEGGPNRPEYKVYRQSRFSGLFRGGDLSRLRERLRREKRPEEQPRPPGAPEDEPSRDRSALRRVLRLVLVGGVVWFLLSAVLFVVSAELQKRKLADDAAGEVGGLPVMLASGQTVLVIGTDARQAGTGEPGAETRGRCLDQAAQGESPSDGCPPFRADTLLLVRAGGGAFEQLSIPRDSYAAIPGQSSQKINGAFAFGGAALQIRAVEDFLGVDVDHVVMLDFDGFTDLIDAIGGVEVDVPRPFKSEINGGFRNGGITLKLSPGEVVLDGDRALAYARTRHNLRDPTENDLDRARRQQDILSGIRSRLTSPWRLPINFARGPWIAWAAPKAMVSDMGGLTLPQLALSAVIGGNSGERVLKPSGPGPSGSILIDQAECARKIEKFLGSEPPAAPACSPA